MLTDTPPLVVAGESIPPARGFLAEWLIQAPSVAVAADGHRGGVAGFNERAIGAAQESFTKIS
ncbi:hypothetical protein HYG77_17760 [Rhodococcus sp. ZPP]|uniref:hypothetical protein n=1 Tax=Rhodococcus sp. ZPP TaxID=2749906 RepID=UPI001AD85822|nr:hypothetical protein [Rhodococcus sp. ZPP]QTJ67240.1 hypothetical protein HYG77_17760 [Rhodococcus sp. ZPP]